MCHCLLRLVLRADDALYTAIHLVAFFDFALLIFSCIEYFFLKTGKSRLFFALVYTSSFKILDLLYYDK